MPRIALLVLLTSLRLLCSCAFRQATDGASSSPESADPVADHRIERQDSIELRLALGRELFLDRSLSLDSSLACSTCHDPFRAFTEIHAVSRGIGVLARRRNTPSLLDLGRHRESFDWDGRAGTLEEQLSGVFAVDGDMGMDISDAVTRLRSDASYVFAFRKAYGTLPSDATLRDALVTFQRSLRGGQSRFERFHFSSDSSLLSPQEHRGHRLFRESRAGCAGCHVLSPELGDSEFLVLADGEFHNLGVGFTDRGLSDSGRYLVTGRESDWGAFATPSLRNVALTAPYMHDGSLATLSDVVRFYAQGGRRNPNLDPVMVPVDFSEQDIADLVAFLKSLTTEWLTDTQSVRQRFLGARSDEQGTAWQAAPQQRRVHGANTDGRRGQSR